MTFPFILSILSPALAEDSAPIMEEDDFVISSVGFKEREGIRYLIRQSEELMFKQKKAPYFPSAARDKGISRATCSVRVFFDAGGNMADATISDCDESFHRVLRGTCKSWAIAPFVWDGEPTPVTTTVDLTLIDGGR